MWDLIHILKFFSIVDDLPKKKKKKNSIYQDELLNKKYILQEKLFS